MPLYSATFTCLPTVPYSPHWPITLWLIPLTVFLRISLPSVTALHSFQHLISVTSVSTSLCKSKSLILLIPAAFYLFIFVIYCTAWGGPFVCGSMSISSWLWTVHCNLQPLWSWEDQTANEWEVTDLFLRTKVKYMRINKIKSSQ